MTRRTLMGCLPLAAAAYGASKPEWRPKLGILGRFTPANVEFAHVHGFTNMILDGGVSSSQVESARQVLTANQMTVSAFQITVNHTDPDPGKRAQINKNFVASIEAAGQLGVPYIGSASGKYPGKPFAAQVDEVVRVYNEQYFRACEANRVRILWEPWPEGPNLATSPVGFSALLDKFGNSPFVGLQYDPSHLVRQFMDPIQTARDFVGSIYDVHLKDTEILWPRLRAGGINPINGASWWRYRIPGMGSIHWREFFSILQDAGYQGAMSIEHEDDLYGAANNPGPDFSDEYKVGFAMGKRYLDQYVP